MSLSCTVERQFTLGSHSLFITYARKESAVQKWLNDHVVGKTHMIGFDTESRPQFVKGGNRNKVATIQLAVPTGHCLVYHIIKDNDAKHEELRSILGNPLIKKVGAGIHGDLSYLENDYSIKLKAALDISKVVKAYIGMVKDMYHLTKEKIEDGEVAEDPEKEEIVEFTKKIDILHFEKIGVAGIAKGLDIPFNKSKKISTSNWENNTLTNSQLHYAAADSWVVVKAHEVILKQLSDHPFPKNHVSRIMDHFN